MKNFKIALLLLLGVFSTVVQANEKTNYQTRITVTHFDRNGSVATESFPIEFQEGVPVQIVQAKIPTAIEFSRNVRGELVGTLFLVKENQVLKEELIFLPDTAELFAFMDRGIAIQLFFGSHYAQHQVRQDQSF